jgi:DNA sulfur modification protein DndB
MGSYSGIPQNNWVDRLQSLADVDWSQQNTALWEGRAMIRGKMSKAQDSIKLTANAIKQLLELARTEEDQKLEQKLHS